MKLHKYLNLFNQVISKGEKQGDGKYHFKQFQAWHDHDGYTCYMSFKDLVLTIYFHSKYDYEYQDEQTLNAFELVVEHFAYDNQYNP